jgi:transposase-like protein
MEKGEKKQARRTYTQEVKLEAVRLAHTGIPKARGSRELGLYLNVLKAWLKQFDHHSDNPFPGKRKMRAEDAEPFRLKRELMKVTAERDTLKKSARVLRERVPVTYAFMARYRSVWPVRI